MDTKKHPSFGSQVTSFYTVLYNRASMSEVCVVCTNTKEKMHLTLAVLRSLAPARAAARLFPPPLPLPPAGGGGGAGGMPPEGGGGGAGGAEEGAGPGGGGGAGGAGGPIGAGGAVAGAEACLSLS